MADTCYLGILSTPNLAILQLSDERREDSDVRSCLDDVVRVGGLLGKAGPETVVAEGGMASIGGSLDVRVALLLIFVVEVPV